MVALGFAGAAHHIFAGLRDIGLGRSVDRDLAVEAFRHTATYDVQVVMLNGRKVLGSGKASVPADAVRRIVLWDGGGPLVACGSALQAVGGPRASFDH